jgi:hypothetical protein
METKYKKTYRKEYIPTKVCKSSMDDIWKETVYDRNRSEVFFDNTVQSYMYNGAFETFTLSATEEIKRLMLLNYSLQQIIDSFEAKIERTRHSLNKKDLDKTDFVNYYLSFCALIKLKRRTSTDTFGVMRIEPTLGFTTLF